VCLEIIAPERSNTVSAPASYLLVGFVCIDRVLHESRHAIRVTVVELPDALDGGHG
jgi:hypothetical protein